MSSEKPLLQLASAATRSQLLELPNELLQEIACYLPTDRDVFHFSLSCKELQSRVFGHESGIWRDLFGRHYEIPPGKSSKQLMMEYITRAIVLNAKVDPKEKENEGERQQLWMEVIQTMLEEAVTLPSDSEESKSLECLRTVLKKVNFLSEPKKSEDAPELFYSLQICLSAFALDPEITQTCRRNDYDMEIVYSVEQGVLATGDGDDENDEFEDYSDSEASQSAEPDESDEASESDQEEGPDDSETQPGVLEVPNPSADKKPQLFIDHKDLDLAKLLHLRSFWQRHLLYTYEYTYRDSFSGLPDILKPQTRKYDQTKGSTLSLSWMGYYSCIHPFPLTLQELERRQTCADCESHTEEVEVMTLELQPRTDLFWPKECWMIAPLAGGSEVKRAAFDGQQGTYGRNEESNHVFGFTEDIDGAHGGFCGWKRICFTLCESFDQEPASLKEGTNGWVHVYEAVIIPGGRTMLGRWVDLKVPSAKGPFIFWDV